MTLSTRGIILVVCSLPALFLAINGSNQKSFKLSFKLILKQECFSSRGAEFFSLLTHTLSHWRPLAGIMSSAKVSKMNKIFVIFTAHSVVNKQQLWKAQTQIHMSWLIIIQYSLQKTLLKIVLVYILSWLGSAISSCCHYFHMQIRIKGSPQQK